VGDPVLILGGGLAGLSAAYFLERPWRLLERSERLGGLAKTDEIDGFLFDATGHWLHLRDPEIRALVAGRWLQGGLVTIERKAAIFSRGVFTRFPYQVNTYGLPPEVIAENVMGFVDAVYGDKGRELRERAPRNFLEFVLCHMGEGFAKNFMLPYNRKLWTVDPSELSAEWCGRFVPKPTLDEVVRGALGISGGAIGYNASFVYPSRGGIEALVRGIQKTLRGGEVELGVEPLAVDYRARKVRTSGGRELSYQRLVSTLSLPLLVELMARGGGVPEEVSRAAERLRATTVTYVRVGIRGSNRQPWHWIYLPEDRFRAYRIGSPSAVYPLLAPPGRASFYVEYSHRGELSAADCERHAVEDLLASEMIRGEGEVLFASAKEIPHAYVIYDHAYGPSKEVLLGFLAQAGVDVAGRYGQWEYSSMEDALLEGRAVAQRLNAEARGG